MANDTTGKTKAQEGSKPALQTRQLLYIVTIACGALLNPLNSSMIAVALSRLQEDFRLSFDTASWLISTYYLTSAVGQPLTGQISDRIGHKRVFMAGLLIVALASALAPFSPNFYWLIGFRMLQALGSSALFPAGMGIIRRSITQNQATALGILSIFTSTSAAFGPTIGGMIIHAWDWPAIFLINFPFIVISFVLAVFVLPAARAKGTGAGHRLDYPGVGLFAAAILAWLYFLQSIGGRPSYLALAAAILGSAGFILLEVKRQHPFIDLRELRRNVHVAFVYLQFILVNIVFYSVFFGIPTYLQNVRHDSSQKTGLIMLAVAGFGTIISPLVGRWIDARGSKPPLITGSSILILGSLLLMTISQNSSDWWIVFSLSVLGLCNGFNNLGLQTALYAFVSKEQTGSASGLFMTSRYMGTILASALLGYFFRSTVGSAELHSIMGAGAIIGLLVLALTLRMPNRRSTD